MAKSGSLFKGYYDDLLDCAVSVFGEQVEYRPLSGGRFNLKAVFDQNFEQIDPDTEARVSVNQPRIEVKIVDLPNGKARQGDKVKLYNTDRKVFELYKVNEVQEDGLGGVVLHLTLQDNE